MIFNPTVEKMIKNSSNFAPPTLSYFLQNLSSCKDSSLLISLIALAIIQNARPTLVIHQYSYQLLSCIAIANAGIWLTFYINLGSVYLFLRRVVSQVALPTKEGTDLHEIPTDSFLYFVTDNVGHNSDTINELNTFHWMEIIAYVTNPEKCQLTAIERVIISSQ